MSPVATRGPGAAPVNAVVDLWRYRELARVLVSKELKLRYRRSTLGFAWTMLNPLLTMLILTAVFSHVWRVQIDSFPVFVLSAMLPWNLLAQSMGAGAFSIIQNEALLKNVRVPRAVFPIAMVSSHLVNFLLALLPLLLVMAWQGVPLRPAVLVLPFCVAALWAFATGITLALSAWTVFFRDLAQIVEVSLMALFYCTPIIYPISIIPEQYAWVFRLNPIYYMTVPFRTIFYEGRFPSLETLAIMGALGTLSLVVGFRVFRRRENLFLHYLS